ncbi:MAG: DUF4166 domain-containing protein [Paracoccaceae bacterium]
MKILILGGYGVFGGRLAALLADTAGLEMLIAGRNLARAKQTCAQLKGAAIATPLALDRMALAARLEALAVDLVVDASGPFQAYGAGGDDPYSVIKACLQARVNYMDFADAADFVFAVSQFDQAARAAGIFVLSGVSSFPVLTAAVLRELAREMEIVSARGGIAPSPYAGIGLNVMRAVVGYAGAPVKLMREGAMTTAPGLAESLRYTIAVPGHLPLRNIHFSLVDVPDLQVIPPEHPKMRDIWMGAGPVPEVLHRTLNLLAKARAAFNLPSLQPLSKLFYTVLNLMKFGEHRGGMFVHALGMKDGAPVERSWHLLAEGDDGPLIPSMAVEALVRKCLNGTGPENGARPATKALSLADYEALFERRKIYAGFRDDLRADQPLYRRVLGAAYADLPEAVQRIHDDTGARNWQGMAQVKRGQGWLSKRIGGAFGFPSATDHIPVKVMFEPIEGGEKWTRQFGEAVFSSTQIIGAGRNAHLLVERFGPVRVALAVVLRDEKLFLIPRRWSFLGLPLPRVLLPSGNSFEAELDGKFQFDVEIAAPLVGLIVGYRGVLEPVDAD